MIARRSAVLGLSLTLGACAAHMKPLPPGEAPTTQERHDASERAGVWSATDIPSLDLKAGPDAKGAFTFDEWVACEYKVKVFDGRSAKFACETEAGHGLKVKYGAHNPEVFGEVLSTRLFWALGFPAD